MAISTSDFICVHKWMIDILGLKTNELMIYAIIYGYSHDGQGEFYGSLKYLEEWTGATKKTVITSLSSLVDKGYIMKSENYINNVKTCKYAVNEEFVPVAIDRMSIDRCVKNYTSGVKISPPSEKITPNNIEDNIKGTIDSNSSSSKEVTSTSKDTKEYGSIYEWHDEEVGQPKDKKRIAKKTKAAKEVYAPNCDAYKQMVLDKGFEDRLEKRILDWLEYKKERGDGYAPTGLKTLLKQIENNAAKYGVGKMCKCIDTCMGRQYMGIVFELLDKMESERPKYNRLD